MCDRFFESVEIPEEVLFNEEGSLNVIHQVGKKVEGGFVGHFLVTRFFQRFSGGDLNLNPKVLLLLSHHGKAHWVSIAHKLGTNFASLQESGSLVIIDTMKNFFEDLIKSGNANSSMSTPVCLNQLFDQCQETIETFRKSDSRRILIVIDNLTNFLRTEKTDCFYESEKYVIQFLQKLNALSTQDSSTSAVTLTAMIQSPDSSEGSVSSEQSQFTKAVTQSFPSVLFEISPLKTGFSAQVTGFLKVVFNPKKGRSRKSFQEKDKKQKAPFIKSYHFKLENNNVRVTPI